MFRIAQALREKGPKKNNYLIIAFSGEELGLYGSKFFPVEHPSIDWAKVNYMLNMDMIGRLDSVLVIGGVGTSPLWAHSCR